MECKSVRPNLKEGASQAPHAFFREGIPPWDGYSARVVILIVRVREAVKKNTAV